MEGLPDPRPNDGQDPEQPEAGDAAPGSDSSGDHITGDEVPSGASMDGPPLEELPSDGALIPRGSVDKVLEGLPVDPGLRDRITSSLNRLEVHAGTFTSPLPPPHILEEYGEVLASAPERLFKMAEAQAVHRQSLEREVVLNNVSRSKQGQWMGFIVALVFGVMAFYLVLNGHEVAGTVLGSVDIVGLVSVFVYGRHEQRKGVRRADPGPPA